MGTIKTTNIEPIANNGTVTLGSSGDTFTMPSGVTVAGAMANTPYFRAYSGSVQTIPHAIATKINFDNTNSLTTASSGYDTTNKRFLPTEAGTYFITASIRIDDSSYSNNNTQIYIYKNNSIWNRFTNDYDSASNPMISVSDIVNLNGSSDYVEIFFYQNTGGSINLYTDTQNMYFSGYKLIG